MLQLAFNVVAEYDYNFLTLMTNNPIPIINFIQVKYHSLINLDY
jgi:hypothetical protein